MTTIESARASGLTAGGDDAETWIAEQRPSADDMRGPGAPDDALINALNDRDLANLIGYDVRDRDGDWTPEARAFFAGYNEGWRETVEKQLASIA